MPNLLLDLPTELRLQVLTEALTLPVSVKYGAPFFTDLVNGRKWEPQNVLLINRQVFREASIAWYRVPYFISYSHGRFRFQDRCWKKYPLQALPLPTWFVKIQNLEVHLWWMEDCTDHELYVASEMLRSLCDVLVRCQKLSRLHIIMNPEYPADCLRREDIKILLKSVKELRNIKELVFKAENLIEDCTDLVEETQKITGTGAPPEMSEGLNKDWLELKHEYQEGDSLTHYFEAWREMIKNDEAGFWRQKREILDLREARRRFAQSPWSKVLSTSNRSSARLKDELEFQCKITSINWNSLIN